MKWNNILSPFVALLMLTVPSFVSYADDDTETIQMKKSATYDYASQRGEITLESYVPGEVKMVQEGKAIDAIIVMDFSSSMTGNDGKYTSSNTYTRTVIDKIYDLQNTYYKNGTKYNTLFSISSSSTPDKIVDTQIFSDDKGTPMKVNYKGKSYDLYAYYVHKKDNYSTPFCWLYISVDGKRIFVRHDNSFIEESGSTTIAYWAFPKGTDGYLITPTSGKERPLYITMKEEAGVKISYRIDALQSAVGNFLDMIAEHAQKTGKTDRVSTVLFQANSARYYPTLYSENSSDNSNDYVTSTKRTYLMECPTDKKRSGTEIKIDSNLEKKVVIGKRFVDMSTQDASKLLKFSISNTTPNGSTPIDKGVNLAKILMEKDGRKDDKVARYVIVFTDGEPTEVGGGTNPYGNVANPAVNYAYDLKQSSYPTNVYTIYCNSSTPATTSKVYKFLDHLSSNYPKAQKYDDTTDKKDTKYFKLAKENLEEIFDEIGQEIIVDVDEKYDKYCSMEDYIDNRYFHYPDDATVDDIHVFENALKSYDSATKTYTFKDEMTEITDKVTVKLKLAKDTGKENDEVLVFGYSYSDNWCGIDQSTNTVHGNRLVVKLPFVFKGGTDVNSVPTNTEDSGMYPVTKNEKGEPVLVDGEPKPDREQGKKYNVPKITFCTMKITRENLHRGETAIYKVTQVNTQTGETRFVANVPIGGLDEATPVEKYLYGLPVEENIKFIAEETNWNWAYIKSDPSALKKEAAAVLEDGFYHVDFKFSGKHIEESDPKKAASLKSHDEDFAENRIDLSTLPTGDK